MKFTEIDKLINGYLDDQLSPDQQQQLQRAMQDDPAIARTVQQLKQTDAQIKLAVGTESAETDDSFEMIYTQAKNSLVIKPRRLSRLRFVGGLAAGLVIGLAAHFVMTDSADPAPVSVPQKIVSTASLAEAAPRRILTNWDQPQTTEPDVHEVDLYYFQDQQGRQWLIEGIRHEMVQQASSGSI